MDEATPNKQWVDTSGDVPPSGIWYYLVAAYNNRCPAEGPIRIGGVDRSAMLLTE